MKAPLVQFQSPGMCGPTALASCAAALGIKYGPMKVCRFGGRDPRIVRREGFEQRHLLKAARHMGLRARPITSLRGPFFTRLQAHVATCGPAVVAVNGGDHWIGVHGWANGCGFVVMDPLAGTLELLTSRQLFAWVGADDHYAILLRRPEGQYVGNALADMLSTGMSMEDVLRRTDVVGAIEPLSVWRLLRRYAVWLWRYASRLAS